MSKHPKSEVAVQNARLRRVAGCVLDQNGGKNRMTLVLGLIAVMTLGLTVPLMLDCLWLVGAILGGTVGVWLNGLGYLLSVASLIFLTLPLTMGLYGMAVEMAVTRDRLCPQTLMPPSVELHRIFDAFTSPRQYARYLVAGLQSVGRLSAVVLVPYVLFSLSDGLLMPVLESSLQASASLIALVAQGVITVAVGALIWLAVCSKRGYAYLVLTNPQLSLREINARFRSVRRPLKRSAEMSLRTAVRLFLSAIPVLVPLLLHTLPCLMISSAVYAEDVFGQNECRAESLYYDKDHEENKE